MALTIINAVATVVTVGGFGALLYFLGKGPT